MTAFTNISSTLWRLREVLELLLFKVFVTQLVLESGEPRWLGKASRELDAALQELRHVEVLRAVETVTLADQLGLAPDMTLAQLAASAPPPWDTILDEHRDALRGLTADIERARSERPTPAGNGPATTAVVAGDCEEADQLHAEVEIVRKVLVETLANAHQASLTAFLA